MSLENLALNTGEKLLLETSPCQRYVLYLMSIRLWNWVVSAVILLLLLNTQGVVSLFSQYVHLGLLENIKWGIVWGLLLLLSIRYLWLAFINNRYRYYFTNERCVYVFQFLSKETNMLPYSRIFNAEIKQNFLQSVFNIADIYINTQNVSDPNFLTSNFPVLKGLTRTTAENITQIISSRIPRV